MKRFAIVMLALVLVCTAAFAAADTLRVGMECNYAPYNWTQSAPSDEAVAIAAGGHADGYDVRIAKAKELLSHTNLKVNEIAARTGFCSSKYFNRVFKKATGISAAQYREAHSVLPGMKS